MDYFKSKKELDTFIRSFNKHLGLRKGSGYYYWVSTDDTLSKKLAKLAETSVYISSQNQLTREQWEAEIEDILFQAYITDI